MYSSKLSRAIVIFAIGAALSASALAIDPRMDPRQALSEGQAIGQNGSCQDQPFECRYYAVAEAAAFVDACLRDAERRNGGALPSGYRSEVYEALSRWNSMNPPEIRRAIYDRSNRLVSMLGKRALSLLSEMSDDDYAYQCSRVAQIRAGSPAESFSLIVGGSLDNPIYNASSPYPSNKLGLEFQRGQNYPR